MSESSIVDAQVLRAQVQEKYRAVAVAPDAGYHFHTGRQLAARLGYDPASVNPLPDRSVESFAGVANPFSLRTLGRGERVVDAGSGAGFDSFLAARQVVDVTSRKRYLTVRVDLRVEERRVECLGRPDPAGDRRVSRGTTTRSRRDR